MQVTAYATEKVTVGDTTIQDVLSVLPPLNERSVIAVASKIVAICEGRVSKDDQAALLQQEADQYIPSRNKYGITLTLKNGVVTPNAGIDHSNGNGQFVLWPSDPQASANSIRAWLREKYEVRKIGVIITDSNPTPLRWGTTGFALAHSGFKALNDYRGKPDIFGETLQMTQANIRDSLAAAAVAVMGEGNEQTPLAVIEDLPFVTFEENNPTAEELATLRIAPEDDLYGPLFIAAPWQKGGHE